ncbi:hypothetical protein C8Q80DRAFT_1153185 [Daedaleopsis nitida]|nr:hypothetical protein C8Q80DRAFT_1153185 [Daedaleopsis nitida]
MAEGPSGRSKGPGARIMVIFSNKRETADGLLETYNKLKDTELGEGGICAAYGAVLLHDDECMNRTL